MRFYILHVFVEHTMHSSFNKGKHFELVSKLRDDSSITNTCPKIDFRAKCDVRNVRRVRTYSMLGNF